MADLEDKLSQILQRTGLNAKQQDGKILLYNRQLSYISKGITVADVPAAIRVSTNYLSYLRTQGFVSLVDWASDNPPRSVPFKEAVNKVDSKSPYYVQALSSISRINLLHAALELEDRVVTARAMREDSIIEESELQRHLKIKKIAAIYRSDFEKVN